MTPPVALSTLLAAAMVGVAVYHLTRLRRGARTPSRAGVDLELGHAAMGAVMAAMLLGVVGSGPAAPVAVIFAGAAAWFGVRAVRGFVRAGRGAVLSLAQPAVGCAAMVVMLAGPGLFTAGVSARPGSATGMAGMAGMAPTRPDVAGSVIAAALIVVTVCLAAGTARGSLVRRDGTGSARHLALGCQLAMNVTTVAMLALV